MSEERAAPKKAMGNEASMQRQLAAILAADIAGYSRLMGEDEAATVRDLKGHQAVVLPLVGRYGGGICISLQVFDQVNRALKVDFQMLGARTLKNIAQPVDVFAIAPSGCGARPGATASNVVDLKQEIHFFSAPDRVETTIDDVKKAYFIPHPSSFDPRPLDTTCSGSWVRRRPRVRPRLCSASGP